MSAAHTEGPESQADAGAVVAEAPAPVIETTDAKPARKRGRKAGPALAEVTLRPELAPALEALLLSLERAAPADRLARALGLLPDEDPTTTNTKRDAAGDASGGAASAPDEHSAALLAAATRQIDLLADHLNQQYEATGRAFRIEQLSGGYRMMTLAEHAGVLAKFHHSKPPAKLSRAAVETLAIIAYKQPLTRAQLEAIRGVACGEVLKTLLDRRLVGIKGRAEELGRPMLYGTTPQFLAQFGLASIKDLPAPTELKLAT